MSAPLNGVSPGPAPLGLSRCSAFMVPLETSRQFTVGILSVCLLADFDGSLSEWFPARVIWAPMGRLSTAYRRVWLSQLGSGTAGDI